MDNAHPGKREPRMENRAHGSRGLRPGKMGNLPLRRARAGVSSWFSSVLGFDRGGGSQLLRLLVCGLGACWLLVGGLKANAFSGTYTGGALNLALPTDDSYDWGTQANYNFTIINSSFGYVATATTTIGARVSVLEAYQSTTSVNQAGLNASTTTLSASTVTLYGLIQSTAGALTAETAARVAADALKVDKNSPDQVNLSTITTALAGKASLASYNNFISSMNTAEIVVASNTFTPTNYALTISSGYLGIDTYTESISTLGASGSLPASTIYWSSASVVQITLNTSPTFAFANAKAGQSLVIYLKQDVTGSRTVTWPTISWASGTAPTLTTTASKRDIVSIFYDGVEYFGFVGGQNY